MSMRKYWEGVRRDTLRERNKKEFSMSKTYDRMIVELSWDVDRLNPGWMNIDNLRACLFGKTFTKPELLSVRVLEDHSLEDANDKLNRLSASERTINELGEALGDVLEDMDSWWAEHYQPDGISQDIVAKYNKRLKESFRQCSWCGGNVFSRTEYKVSADGKSEPQVPVTFVDHQLDCPFKERG